MKNIPPTQGRGKWGRRIKHNRHEFRNADIGGTGFVVIEERTGSGVHVSVTSGMIVERPRTPGVIHQGFYSSPRLRQFFERHDSLIDAHLAAIERAEYHRLCRECAAYRARKAAQMKARAGR